LRFVDPAVQRRIKRTRIRARPYRERHYAGGRRAAAGWTSSGIGHHVVVGPAAILVRFDPALNRRIDKAQYVTAVDDPLAVETLGARYVFATIDQTTLALDTRVDWTFSPTLSLQLYTQPLIVSGRYTDWKELRAPRTFAFDIYGRDQGTIAGLREATSRSIRTDPGRRPRSTFPTRASTSVPLWEMRCSDGNIAPGQP